MGIVKFFGGKDKYDLLYGFLIPKEGEYVGDGDVFFHTDAGETLQAGVDYWTGKAGVEFTHEKQHRTPQTGDRIVFRINYARFRAEPWGFADEYEEVKRQIESKHAIATATR